MQTANGPAATVPSETTPPAAVLAALDLLHRARQAARDVRLDVWEFAVGLPELAAAGLTTTDVRWLAAKGYVEHAVERVRPDRQRRSFSPVANFALTARTCLVLTDAGAAVLHRWRPPSPNGPHPVAAAVPVPRWDAARRQLWYRGTLVKQFRVPADSQEAILAAFQEAHWPPRLPDPLRPAGGNLQQRLHDAVKGLNRNQAHRLLVFRRDGTGRGVTWSRSEGA